MSMNNSVTIVGNLTRDPELRYTPSGAAVVKFAVAVNRYFTNRAGDKVEQTDFIDVTAWRGMAENIAESFHTGDRVIVTGRFQQDRWEEEATSNKRSKIYLVADEVGASARFATVEITKVKTSGPSDWSDSSEPDPSPEELAEAKPAKGTKGKAGAKA